jgi:hypothetical protein
MKLFWIKFSNTFCKIDHFISVEKIVHNSEMVYLTKKSVHILFLGIVPQFLGLKFSKLDRFIP